MGSLLGSPHRLTVLSGHPSSTSRTLGLLLRFADLLGAGLEREGVDRGGTAVIDLADVAPHRRLERALAATCQATLLVAGSPTFKGSYSGLLKAFLDVLPRSGLAGAVAVPVMTVASLPHRHAVDSHLAPLLRALGATVPAPGVSVLESDLAAPEPVLTQWINTWGPALAGALEPGLVR